MRASFRTRAELGSCRRLPYRRLRETHVLLRHVGVGTVAQALDEQVALERAVDELPDTARVVVWLHDVEGYTHKEIGQMMGYTASFSKSQLARAHERLRVLLQGEQEESGTELCTPVLKTC